MYRQEVEIADEMDLARDMQFRRAQYQDEIEQLELVSVRRMFREGILLMNAPTPDAKERGARMCHRGSAVGRTLFGMSGGKGVPTGKGMGDGKSVDAFGGKSFEDMTDGEIKQLARALKLVEVMNVMNVGKTIDAVSVDEDMGVEPDDEESDKPEEGLLQ
jgi:hypothetical protein